MHAIQTASPSLSPASSARSDSAAPARGWNETHTAWLALAVLIPFLAYSFKLVGDQGYLGFIYLAGREPWGMQMLIDLVIACTLGMVWMVPDARRRSLTPWPWVALTVTFGSIGLLGYLVRRGFAARR